ncbi:MAG: hypothetical protein C4520_16960 [Candidatus Abyssobacteria bacterium SURF_5]|uniref:Uncharacterized protein n=1 Tax=Abyssobacteria bacterium (strain SURF_5) TaxID=2093360 RepID=A0A3A4NDC3_ABYX5|nr:MAG: hypothetical protein C4520_16960 [Candidatus Abyssubacteria bacterium SURF_5]
MPPVQLGAQMFRQAAPLFGTIRNAKPVKSILFSFFPQHPQRVARFLPGAIFHQISMMIL